MSGGGGGDQPALRGLIAVLGALGLLALVGVAVLAVQQERYRRDSARTESSAGYVENILAECLRVSGGEGAPSAQACEEARGHADLLAQRSMATAAWVQFMANLVGLALLAATVFYAHRAWEQAKLGAALAQTAANETKRQADIAQTQLIEAREPVLYVAIESWDLSDLPRRIPTAKMYVMNLGDRLAIVTGGRFGLFYGEPNGISKRKIMDDAHGIPSFITIGTRPLRAGESLRRDTQCVNMPFSYAGLEGSIWSESRETLYLAGWVEYSDQWGHKYEQSFLVMYSAPSIARPDGEWAVVPIQGLWPEQ